MGVPHYDVLIKLVKYAELDARGGRPSELTATHLDCVCNCRSPSTAPLLPLMSAPELPSELTGHMATLRGECDAHAKARAVAARSSGKAHLAASGPRVRAAPPEPV